MRNWTEDKFTDKQIIRALECCIGDGQDRCERCPLDEKCSSNPFVPFQDMHALALINRQKAEIKQLRERISYLGKSIECSRKEYNRLLQKLYVQVDNFDELDNLVKEMTEE